MLAEQNYHLYTAEDHRTWSLLFERQNKITYQKASREYHKGCKHLSLEPDRIAHLGSLNEKLKKISDWQLVGVEGLVPTKDFFQMLLDRNFPITVNIRKPEELSFSKLPDIFHDIFGHVPMLLNTSFCDFVVEFSKLGLEFIDVSEVEVYLSRLYWFTMEMGLIKEDGEQKIYGGAILTSSEEINNIYSDSIPKHPFGIKKVITTDYDNLELQNQYFVIDGFHQLFNSLNELRTQFNSIYVKPQI